MKKILSASMIFIGLTSAVANAFPPIPIPDDDPAMALASAFPPIPIPDDDPSLTSAYALA